MHVPEGLIAAVSAGDPEALLPGWQMTVSLGSHIVLACFGVAFPAMIFVVHRRGLRDDDPVALGLAQRWSKVAAVLFAVGAVSGTILSFEMGLLWSELMRRFGEVLGLPFALEGIAFFIEAIFSTSAPRPPNTSRSSNSSSPTSAATPCTSALQPGPPPRAAWACSSPRSS